MGVNKALPETMADDKEKAESGVTGKGLPSEACLLVVATPIGNLEDISPRANAALRAADLVAAEDTRRTRILLSHLGLHRPLISYRSHNQARQGEHIVDLIRRGKTIALVTDAGTPCVSDPGFLLVRQAADAGIAIVPIPGPSALTAAVSICGFPAEGLIFEGFLPRKKGRQTKLRQLAAQSGTVIFFESPHRIAASIRDLAALCPQRPAMVARELTKIHEEVLRGTLAELAARLPDKKQRGEFVVVLGPHKDSG